MSEWAYLLASDEWTDGYDAGYRDAVAEFTGHGLYDHDSDGEMDSWDEFLEQRKKEAGCPGTGTTRSPE